MTAGRLGVAVEAHGAQLVSLHDAEAGELLWQSRPPWLRSAPVLFPVVGQMRNGLMHHNGRQYHMPQHGFARDRVFSWVTRGPTLCRLALEDDPTSRAIYPFAFRLELEYSLSPDRLAVTYRVLNTGTEMLPASCGGHPGFRWPLAPHVPPEAHRLTFANDEGEPIRRLSNGLLDPVAKPTPVQGRVLHLHRSLFAIDAVIFDRLSSRSVRYGAPGVPGLEFGWYGFTELGVWSRQGGSFLCIEPWHGTADPVDFDDDFIHKPGLMLIAPGEARTLQWWVRPLGV